MTEKVSVIVPVYKVEQYLARCVNSLLEQTYAMLEIILVDDGSPDNSGAICDDFAAQDERVRVFHMENRGVSAARNTGLDAATGDWICFCDSDDWYDPHCVEKMLRCAHEEGADYVVCDYQIAAEGRGSLASGSVDGLFSGCENRLVIALGPTSSCTHMIRRTLFENANVRYPEGCRQSEELPVIPVLAKDAARIGVVKEPLYFYFQRGDGTSASNAAVQSEENFRTCWSIMREKLGEGYEPEAEYHAIYALLYGEVLNLCKRKASAKEIRQKVKDLKEEFPSYRSNPYLKQMGKAKELFLLFVELNWVIPLRLLAWVHGKIVN